MTKVLRFFKDKGRGEVWVVKRCLRVCLRELEEGSVCVCI